jgi:glycosyltransferase involved in cell wall biosynthesis
VSDASSPETRPLRAAQTVTVMHVFGRMDRGGAEVRTLDVLRASRSAPVAHEFVCLSGLPGALDDEFRAIGATIHLLPLSATFPVRFVRLLRCRRVDVLHSHVHLFSGGLLALAAVARVPGRIAHFRATTDGRPSTWKRRIFRRVQHVLVDRFATTILAVGTGAMDAWSPRWAEDPRCAVILNGIDTDCYATAIENGSQRLSLPSSLSEDTTVVAFVGHLSEEKRVDVALSAFAEWHRGGAHFLVVGGGTEARTDATRQLIRELDIGERVSLLGVRSDVPEILCRADVLLLTSSSEGLPGVVLEALAVGTPVVATRLPGTEEIASFHQHVTLIDASAAPVVWADALERATADRPDLAERHRRHVEFAAGPFRIERSAAAHVAIWTAGLDA